MKVRRSESGFYVGAGRSRSACDRQTPTSVRGCPFSCGGRSDRDRPAPSRIVAPRLFAGKEYRNVESQEPHTKSKKNFPVELRAKTTPPAIFYH